MCKTKLVFTNSWRSKKEKHKRMFFIIPAVFSSTDCWKRQCIGILILLTKLDFTHFCVAFDHITTDLFIAVCRLKFSKQDSWPWWPNKASWITFSKTQIYIEHTALKSAVKGVIRDSVQYEIQLKLLAASCCFQVGILFIFTSMEFIHDKIYKFDLQK